MADKSSQGAAKGRKRGPGRPFAKGQSGNPAGGKKLTEEQKKERRDAREMLKAAAPDAVALLIRTMHDEEAKLDLRLRCAETVCDRVYGKSPQPIIADVAAEVSVVLGDAEELAQ